MGKKLKKPVDPTPKPVVGVSPQAFLLVLERHRGDANAACAELECDPAPVHKHRREDERFRERWDRIVGSMTREVQKRFLQEYRATHKVVLACRAARIPRETAYRLRQDDPNFQLEWALVEDEWEARLGQPGGHHDRNTDADIDVIGRRIRGPGANQVVGIYRNVLSSPEEWIPRGMLSGLGIPPTSVQRDYDEWPTDGARRGGQGRGAIAYARSYLIEMLVYRHKPEGSKKSASRAAKKRSRPSRP